MIHLTQMMLALVFSLLMATIATQAAPLTPGAEAVRPKRNPGLLELGIRLLGHEIGEELAHHGGIGGGPYGYGTPYGGYGGHGGYGGYGGYGGPYRGYGDFGGYGGYGNYGGYGHGHHHHHGR